MNDYEIRKAENETIFEVGPEYRDASNDERRRMIIRACLRRLGPERRQLEAIVSAAEDRHGEVKVRPVRELLPEEGES